MLPISIPPFPSNLIFDPCPQEIGVGFVIVIALNVPATVSCNSNAAEGLVVPIPMFPELLMVIAVVLLVSKLRAKLSLVPIVMADPVEFPPSTIPVTELL